MSVCDDHFFIWNENEDAQCQYCDKKCIDDLTEQAKHIIKLKIDLRCLHNHTWKAVSDTLWVCFGHIFDCNHMRFIPCKGTLQRKPGK